MSWAQIVCFFRGHCYKPMHEMRGRRARYHCDRCGKPTHWMHEREHRIFTYRECPTWGPQGSDSQGYREAHQPNEQEQR